MKEKGSAADSFISVQWDLCWTSDLQNHTTSLHDLKPLSVCGNLLQKQQKINIPAMNNWKEILKNNNPAYNISKNM